MIQADDRDFLAGLPKVELHLHLEGAIPLPALLELTRKYGSSEVSCLEDLERRFEYKDFPSFIDTWVWKNQFLKSYEDFEFIAAEVAQDLADQGIVYADAFYSAADFRSAGLEVGGITEAVRSGLSRHADRIRINLVADLVRDFGPERGQRTLDELRDVLSYGVVGIGIGGSEQAFPPEPFAAVFERARELGLRTSCHAGEAAGAESVWGAIRALKVDRIGHGARAIEDPTLVQHLLDTGTHVELCPISNLRTGVVADIASHPVGTFYRRGLHVSVNTDDPKMFNNSLFEEFELLIGELGFERSDIVRLQESAIGAAWCDDALREELRARLRDYAEGRG